MYQKCAGGDAAAPPSPPLNSLRLGSSRCLSLSPSPAVEWHVLRRAVLPGRPRSAGAPRRAAQAVPVQSSRRAVPLPAWNV